MEKVILKRGKSFNIEHILECGQCFNFEKIEEKYYKITAYNKVLYIKEEGEDVVLFPCTNLAFDSIWKRYFDLEKDYDVLKEILRKDNILNKAIEYGEGIRILNQEHFECLISFIISQNNRIPMIKNVVRNLSVQYGDKIEDGYSFPKIETLAKVSDEELRLCKTGFRSKYIIDCCNKIHSNEINLNEIEKLKSEDILEELLKIKGVGVKVANCVLLFSYGRGESFPVDVWIKRAMEHFYFDGEEKNKDYIQKFGEEKFGDLSGIAQQYIFNYAIKTNLKI
ncbi:MAG: DNA-3-methyladenine glycosylase family protein [Lachnospirales bacterium]